MKALQKERVKVIEDLNNFQPSNKFKKITTKNYDFDDVLKRSAALDKHNRDIDLEGDTIIKTFDKDRKLFTRTIFQISRKK